MSLLTELHHPAVAGFNARCYLYQLTMKYIIWYRRKNDPNALWGDMAYAPRYLDEAEDLKRHYEEEWGNLYEYEIHRGGFVPTFPNGTRQPCFPGCRD